MLNRRSNYRRHIIGILSANSGIPLTSASITALADSLADAVMECEESMNNAERDHIMEELALLCEDHRLG